MKIRKKIYALLVLALILLNTAIAAAANADNEQMLEHQIKAAFLYNFVKFIDWPQEITTDANKPIIIGIIGKNEFSNAFKLVKNKKINDRKVIVTQFEKPLELINDKDENSRPNRKIDELKKCHLLFFSNSLKKDVFSSILKTANPLPVLTVGDLPGFLEAGGIINFLIENKKVRFEVNLKAAERSNLKIRANLLKLAKRIIKEKRNDKD